MANGQKDFIMNSLDFIGENLANILLISIIFFLIASYMIIHNVEFPKTNGEVTKVVVMETMVPASSAASSSIKKLEGQAAFNKILQKGLCNTDSLDPGDANGIIKELDNRCRKLESKGTCSNATCCVWATSKKGKGLCLGGSAPAGPTKIPKNFKFDEYYYLGKKYPH